MDFDIAKEWHPVTLPSYGIYYGDTCPGGKMDIAVWSTAQEELILRYSSQAPARIIDEVVKSSIRLPDGLAYEDLLVTDRFFLLVNLRAISLMPEYTVTHECPGCGQKHPVTANLLKMDVKVPDGDNTGIEPFEVELPKCKRTVGVRLFRVADEQAMLQYEERILQRRKDGGSPKHRYRLARQIVTIDGESPAFDVKMRFAGSLTLFDNYLIRAAVEQYSTGYDPMTNTVCPRCGEEDRFTVRLSPGFFRPSDAELRAAAGMAPQRREGDELSGVEGVQLDRRTEDVVSPSSEAVSPQRRE
jgi:hypothetical protein